MLGCLFALNTTTIKLQLNVQRYCNSDVELQQVV